MNKVNKIKVLLVDDHAVVRAGFSQLLATTEIDVIAEAQRGEQAIQLYQQSQPDVVVMDLSMPGIGGLEAIRRIIHHDPNAKILVFSIHNETVYAERAIGAGARGYISKSSAPDILVIAVKQIAQDKHYIESSIQQRLNQKMQPYSVSNIDQLSPREFDIFCHLAQGKTTHHIANELCLAYKTVANHSTQIKNKLNVKTIAELTLIAISAKVI